MRIVESGQNPYAGRMQRQSPEMRIQADCVRAAWNDFPETRNLLFHVENENPHGNSFVGAIRRAQGVIRGVSDLVLLLPRGKWHALLIEMKTKDGSQSKWQKEWQALVESHGYRYEVIRSEEDFRALLTEYLAEK